MRSLITISAVLLIALAVACSPTGPKEPPASEGQPTDAAAEAQAKATRAPAGEASMAVDGVVVEGEYPHELTAASVRVLWRNDGETLWLAMVGQTTGWVSVGLAPELRMQGANYVIGAVEDGAVTVWDAYGTAPTGPTHPTDESLGGTHDITAFAGGEQDGVTTIEVALPLDSGDAYDKPLQPGATIPIIVAVGRSDAYDAGHAARGSATLTLDPAL